ncbi:class I SAM-dependent methyltransferase [Mesobacillus harenae]|uniref:class I SAM-dependent methyltransferase n=1 Tax=Mesobacillus harenae TaxID=2213203 RepID=UPI00158056F5|nr:class I SAM-dependent methyltransferase [Mesobacillus harenae]
MKLDRILPFARNLLKKAIQPGDIAVDATLGNGHDTLFLANLVGPEGKVYGFDIQAEALFSTRSRLQEHQLLDRTVLLQKGHENINTSILPEHYQKITGGIFNLGYLPGGDKSIVTKASTTIAAVEQLLEFMPKGGIIVLVIYHGHSEGATERDELLKYATDLNQNKFHVLHYQFVNQKNNPPFIIAIEKK